MGGISISYKLPKTEIIMGENLFSIKKIRSIGAIQGQRKKGRSLKMAKIWSQIRDDGRAGGSLEWMKILQPLMLVASPFKAIESIAKPQGQLLLSLPLVRAANASPGICW